MNSCGGDHIFEETSCEGETLEMVQSGGHDKQENIGMYMYLFPGSLHTSSQKLQTRGAWEMKEVQESRVARRVDMTRPRS